MIHRIAKCRLFWAVLFVLAFAGPCLSDSIATYALKEGSELKVSFGDSEHIRMDTTPDSYLLLTGRKVYMVTKDGDGWSAMDVEQMAAAMKAFTGKLPEQPHVEAKSKITKTSRKETIAGFTGDVWIVEHQEAGRWERSEVVLTSHPDLKAVNDAWIRLAKQMSAGFESGGSSMPSSYWDDARKDAPQAGMLRAGDEIVLRKFEKASLGANYYQLPSGVKFMDTAGAGGADPAAGFAKDTADKAVEAAKSSAQDSVVEGVTQGVKGLFKNVW